MVALVAPLVLVASAALPALTSLVAAPSSAFAVPSSAKKPSPRFLDGSLPRHEPRDRMIDIRHMDLRVSLDLARRSVEGYVDYQGVVVRQTDHLELAAVDLDVVEALWIDAATSSPAAFERNGDTLRFALRVGNAATPFHLRIRYKATPRKGLYVVGPDADEPRRPWHLWSQGETSEARHWIPCPDDPDERMTWTVTATAPASMVVLSNGVQIERRVEDQWATTSYRLDKPHPVYLLSLLAGPFVEAVHPHPKVRISTWTLSRENKDAVRAYAKVPDMLDFFDRQLAVAYPWPSYGQALVESFPMGGMENVTLASLTARAVPNERSALDWDAEGLAAHELAHQWFGDRVTCRTWADIWLNEGFATFYEKLWQRHAHGEDRFDEAMDRARTAVFTETREVYSRPIVSDRYGHPGQLFDRHSYSKGAWVLHMLREQLGAAPFDAAITAMLRDYAFSSVETDDLRRALESATGQSLRGLFDRWLRRPGHPQIRARIRYDAANRTLRIHFAQRQPITVAAPAFDLPIEIAVRTTPTAVATQHVFRLNERLGEWTLAAATRPEVIEIDPRMALLVDWQIEAGVDVLAAMRDHGKRADVRLRAVRSLKSVVGQQRGVSALIRALASDPARHVRAEAASVLGAAPRAAAGPALVKALATDPESKVRAAAAEALARHFDPATWADLEKAARRDRSHVVQKAALAALFGIDRQRALSLITQATGWPSQHDVVQGHALSLLARYGRGADLARLWKAAGPGHSKLLRAQAALALAEWASRVPGRRDAVRGFLESMIREPDTRLRGAIAQAIAHLGDPASRRALLDAADREVHLSLADRMRRFAAELGAKLPVEERVLRLEQTLEELRRGGLGTGKHGAGRSGPDDRRDRGGRKDPKGPGGDPSNRQGTPHAPPATGS